MIGLHFFNPVPVMGLVEMVRRSPPRTRPSSSGAPTAVSLGKTTVLSRDRAGFIVNTLLIPYLNDAVRMLEEGFATREDLDTAIHLGLNHPMGPLRLADLIGLDTCLQIAERPVRRVQGAEVRAAPAAEADGHGRPARPEDRPGLLRLPLSRAVLRAAPQLAKYAFTRRTALVELLGVELLADPWVSSAMTSGGGA